MLLVILACECIACYSTQHVTPLSLTRGPFPGFYSSISTPAPISNELPISAQDIHIAVCPYIQDVFSKRDGRAGAEMPAGGEGSDGGHCRRVSPPALRADPGRDGDRLDCGDAAAGDIQPCAGAGGDRCGAANWRAPRIWRVWAGGIVGAVMDIPVCDGEAPSWCGSAGTGEDEAH
ncbi:hypothetical protein Dimus_028318 [Dionaea muscipula]